ncbi:two-component system, sensor histidine kinase RegB [Methylophilaceae bacterium]|nr:two-component system, sensor histidine kinase RegB [Methylophilaceae bacterium]
MFARHTDPLTAAVKNLRRLFWLRFVMIGFLTLTMLLLVQLQIPLQLRPIAATIGTMLLLNVFTWWRLQSDAHVTEPELVVQLLGDIATLTTLFYLTGGYSNPFVWMYLLPLAIAAVALRTIYVWLLAALAVACYSGLVFFHIPLSHLHVHSRTGINLDIHLVGMWLGFVVSAGIIAFFVTRIGQNLREHDLMIAQARETALESERMMALGTLATAAAHELGTPLATMAVLANEMAEENSSQPQLQKNLALLRQQVARCKEILTSLTASAGDARAENSNGVALDNFLENTIQRWRDSRPAVQFASTVHGAVPAPLIVADRTLGMALLNLLDNAADASPDRVEMHGEWNNTLLIINIRDYGAGLTPEAEAQAGTPFFTTKRNEGMGLGLYLARMIMGRFGGSVKLDNHPGNGTVTSIRLPLEALLVKVAE